MYSGYNRGSITSKSEKGSLVMTPRTTSTLFA